MDLSSNAITNLIAGLSLFISLFTGVFYLRDRNRSKFQITSEYIKQLLEWHGNTVEILISLRLFVEYKIEFNKSDLLSKLSSQIEKGRFYFPNVDINDGFGLDKPTAYQGYRNLALDFLVYSYNLFLKPDSHIYLKHAEKLQREFTSFVFQIINPKNILDEIHKLTNKYYLAEDIFEDYLSNNPEAIQFMKKK